MRRSAVVFALASLAACGPNYRYVYDGESAFERCYALDYDTAADVPSRSSCWSTWLQSFSYGATVDRQEYARTRLTALNGANPNALPNAAANATPPTAPGGAPGSSSAAPALPAPPPGALAPSAPPAAANAVTSSAPARPTGPGVSVDTALGASPSRPSDPWGGRISGGGNPVVAPPPTQAPSAPNPLGPEPPGQSCAADCRGAWSTCSGRCVQRDAACVARCDEGYRDCMRGCF